MQEIKAIIRSDRLQDVIDGLHRLPDLPGVTVSKVRGFGRRAEGAGTAVFDQTEFTKLKTVVDDAVVESVVATILERAGTGGPGDGKIFVMPVLRTIRIRDGGGASRQRP